MSYESRPEESKDPVDLGVNEKFIAELLVEYNRGNFEMFAPEPSTNNSEMQPVLFRFTVRTPAKEISTVEFSQGLDAAEHTRLAKSLDSKQAALLETPFEDGQIFNGHEDIVMRMAAIDAIKGYYKILGGMVVFLGNDILQEERSLIVYPKFYRDIIQEYSGDLAVDQFAYVSDDLDFEDDIQGQQGTAACLSLLFLNSFYDPGQISRVQLS